MYSFTLPDADQPRTYNDLSKARTAANKVAKRLTIEVEVVRDSDSQVVHVATYVEGRHFHPFERVETPKVPSARHFEGFRPAYQRIRAAVVVYRALDERSWLVLDTVTGGRRKVATTKAACLLTNRMNPAKEAYRIPAGERGETA